MLKHIKKIIMIFISIILLIVVSTILFLWLAPQIGKTPSGLDLERIKTSPNYNGEIFINKTITNEAKFKDVYKSIPKFFSNKIGFPPDTLPAKFQMDQKNNDSSMFITWFGHSAFMLEVAEKKILIDPMFGKSTSPIYVTNKRFPYRNDIPVDSIKDIDYVLFSHDHYDHLDYPTIKKIKNDVGHFYVPLGVGTHLKYWNVEENKVSQYDWWETVKTDDLELIFCPSRHFSGRGFTGRNTSLWGSWVIRIASFNIYFSGDSGYGEHFKEIGEKLGPFDFAMIECGQYNKAWSNIHMMPEESAQAGKDLKADLVMPIHWGAFKLSIHEWDEPVKRFTKKADELGLNYIHPKIGERFELGKDFPKQEWWKL